VMRQIGHIYILDTKEEWLIDSNPFFSDKIVICFAFAPSPEKVWSRDEMIQYCHAKNMALVNLGLLTDDVISQLAVDGYVEVAVEFTDIIVAKQTIEKMMDVGLVDIYLYQNGRVVDKYD